MKINYPLVLVFFVIAFMVMVVILYVRGTVISPIIVLCVIMSFIGVLGIIFVTDVVEKKKTVSSSIEAVKEAQKIWNKENPEDQLEIIEGAWDRKTFPNNKNYVGIRMKRKSTQRVVVVVYCVEDHDLPSCDMTPRPAKLSNVFHGFDPGHSGGMGMQGMGYQQRPYPDRFGRRRYPHDYEDYGGGYGGGGYTPPPSAPMGHQPQQNTENTKREKEVVR